MTQPTLTEGQVSEIRQYCVQGGIHLEMSSGVPVVIPVRSGFLTCPGCGRLPSSVMLEPGTLSGGRITYEGCGHVFRIPRGESA
ncbi:hypothetical protein [Streptomyces sp. NPDC002537]